MACRQTAAAAYPRGSGSAGSRSGLASYAILRITSTHSETPADAMRPDAATHAEMRPGADRKSTRLNSSHGYISYAVFCLKKKKKEIQQIQSSDPVTTHSH